MVVFFNHSVMFDFVTLWPAACQASLSSPISRSLLKLMSFDPVVRNPQSHC